MGIAEVVTAPRSPWQNPYAERLIGSIRRECLDHVIILNERHLRRVLSSYFNTITTPERISRSTRTVHGLASYKLPRPATSLPSQRLAACIIAMSAEPPEGGPMFAYPSNCRQDNFEQGQADQPDSV